MTGRLALFLRGLAALVLLQIPGTLQAQVPASIGYAVALHPRADRTDIGVRVELEGDWLGQVEVQPPRDCYGSLRLADFMTAPVLSSGDTLAPASGGGWMLSVPAGGAAFSYSVSYPPEAMTGAFAPNTSPGHFHAAGCQWMVIVGDPAARRTYSVEIPDAPPGWEVYSTWGRHGQLGYIDGSYDDVATSAIGGEAGTSLSFAVKEHPVDVYVADGFAVPTADIAAMVADIVEYQRDLMGIYDFPFYFIAIRPRDNVIAGTSVDHMLITFVKPQATRREIGEIVSHEMFHVFLPHTLQVVSADDDSYARFLWFHEGVVEYMARKILVDLGYMSRDEEVEALNSDLWALADSPHRAWPYARLRDVVETNGYSSSLMKFNYYRGSLIAARWDEELDEIGAASLSQVLERMVHEAQGGDGLMEATRFFEIGAEQGLDIRRDFERFVLEGERIVPPADWAGSEYELECVQLPRFDLGFDLRASWRARATTGVREDGPAYAAGLRNGMPLIRTLNTTRDSNTWEAEAPAEVVVEDTSGEERRIAYMARGDLQPVAQYVRVEREGDAREREVGEPSGEHLVGCLSYDD